ncbi:MAG: hypothetical protein GY803_27480 [Chloroflexi bacterium]|nr:hypothetical protein [Chloroflexota bacterium]
MFTTIVFVYAILSVIASLLIITAAMLSSRISREENFVEVHEVVDKPLPIVPNAYSLEV